MLTEFQDPPKQFRPSPFWSWNDDLNEEELVRQVKDFKEKGFGGYFMHSRVGLRTPYLSTEWMRCVRACLIEGKKSGLESWLYDEDKWPSGAAGGLVTRGRDELRSRGLSLVRTPSAGGNYLAVFDLDEKSGSYQRIGPDAAAGAEKIAFEIVLAPKINWFNGESYADLLNREAVEAFLNTTYEAYAAEFPGEFGEFMPGIFTDEPHFRCGDLPWSDQLPAYFKELNDYDIVSRLPDLFFDLPNCAKTRYDFWRTATKMFVETFSRRLYEWCEAHGIGLTGHYLHEDNLLAQMLHAGAAMPHYEFQQYPGIDHLGRNINNPLTLKQVSSVAHQLRRKRVLCEIYGVSGHSMTFEDQKWIADFHFALGINFICQHLVLYSMKGERKRDYPPTFSYHQPYWCYYWQMNDYLARCSYAISLGKFAPDVLLLHPIATAWTVWRKGNDKIVADYNRRFVELMTRLLEMHRGFDLGDELIMEKHGTSKGETLRVGSMEYKAVVVPPSKNWGRAAFDLLEQFSGPIVFIGEPPTMVAGERTSRWETLLKRENVFLLDEDGRELASLLDKLIPRHISIADDNGQEMPDIYSYHRVSEKGHVYFLTNTSRSKSHSATVRLAARGRVNEWDASGGSVHEVEAPVSGGHTLFKLDFPPAGSKILTVEEVGRGGTTPRLEEVKRIAIGGPWPFRRTHPNSMTLDFCQVAINNSPFSRWQPLWKARREVRKFFDLEKYQGLQPWLMDEMKVEPHKDSEVELRFEFEVREKPKRIYLVVEEGFRFRLTVNGKEVDTATDEWHWDRQFSKIDIAEAVMQGKNRVSLRCNYQWDTEIEEIYLVGDFAVRGEDNRRFWIVREPARLGAGDWGAQGYPFYSGNMIYEAKVEVEKKAGFGYLLDLSKVRCSVCRAAVNGQEAGLVAWQPWRVDITPLLEDGSNSVEVEVVSTLRNTMGPLHHTDGDELPWVGPEQFVDEAKWTDKYNFVPYGIFADLELVICRRVK